jgi:metal-responsive CopG/Arc/MetJ family transcriptional regulator
MGVHKMKKRIRPQISIILNQGTLDEVDRLSKKMRMNRSQLINNILVMGVEDVRVLERIGLIDLAEVIRRFQMRVSKNLSLRVA